MRGECDGPLAREWGAMTGGLHDASMSSAFLRRALLWEQDARYRAAENERLRWMLYRFIADSMGHQTKSVDGVEGCPICSAELADLDRRYREREG